MSTKTPKASSRIADFWFMPQRTEALALFRILFGLYLLLVFFVSIPNWQRFYGPDGLYPYWLFMQSNQGGWTVLWFSDSAMFVWALNLLLILASIFFALGRFVKLSSFILFVGYHSLNARNPWITNSHDHLAEMLLFFCCFAPLSSSLSLDCAKRKREQFGELASVWAWRLMQISLAGVYLFTVIAQLQNWYRGDAVYYATLSHQWFRFPEVDFFHTAAASRLGTYATLLLEILFPFLIWTSSARVFLLPLMFLMHIVLLLLLSPMELFPNLMMLVSLTLFIDSKWIADAIIQFRKKPAGKTQRLKKAA